MMAGPVIVVTRLGHTSMKLITLSGSVTVTCIMQAGPATGSRSLGPAIMLRPACISPGITGYLA